MKVDTNFNQEYVTFDADEKSQLSVHYKNIIPYFL
jgi:hypothetical protein